MRAAAILVCLVSVLLLLLAPPAFGQGFPLVSGQKVSASITADEQDHVYRFHAVKGDLLSLSFVPSKKTALRPVATLLGPPDAYVRPPAFVDRKLKLKKLLVSWTGTYYFVIQTAGTEGDYTLSLKLKGAKVPPAEVAVPGTYELDATAGAVLTAKVKAAKKTDLMPGIDSVVGPDGAALPLAGALSEKGGAASIKKLAIGFSGRQTMTLAVRGGAAGTATVKVKLKAAKPAPKKLATVDLVDAGLLKLRFGGAFLVEAWAAGDSVNGASLVFPSASGLPDLPLVFEDGKFVYGGEFPSEVALEKAFPDGRYVLRVTRGTGPALEFPMLVTGAWPTAPEITSPGAGATPTVTWTGGDGAQFHILSFQDRATAEEDYEVFMPANSRTHTVPAGPLHAARTYDLSLVAFSSGRKVALARWPLPGEVTSAGGSLGTGRRAVEPPWGTRFALLQAILVGNDVLDVKLRYPGGAEEALTEVDDTWRYARYAPDASAFPDGTYTFLVRFYGGKTDDSHSFSIGGTMPDFGVNTLRPEDSTTTGALGASPEIAWGTTGLEGGPGYDLIVRDADGNVAGNRSFPATTGSWTPPAGMLTADRWYLATLSMDNGQGKAAFLHSAFYTGDPGGGFEWEAYKTRTREDEGPARTLSFWIWLAGTDITSAKVVAEDGTEYALTDDGAWTYASEYATEAALDAAFPDGLYRLEFTMANGAVCPFMWIYLGGGWPDWLDVVSPADGAVGVSRTPDLAWAYGDLGNFLGLICEMSRPAPDGYYGYALDADPGRTTFTWADFASDDLPASKRIDVALTAIATGGKSSVTETSFTTRP